MTSLIRRNAYWPMMFDRHFNTGWTSQTPARTSGEQTLSAPIDIVEGDVAFTIRMDMPGVKKEDVSISVENGRLTISGERKSHNEETDKNGKCYCSERRYGKISRSFSLGKQVDAEKIEARLSDGVLELTLPKRPEVAPKEIPVN